MLAGEPLVRLGVFVAVLATMALWEARAPRRRRAFGRMRRWPGNLGIVAIDTLLIRVVAPAGAVGLALWLAERGWGLFNMVATPAWLAIPLSVLVLDLAIYGQHVAFHAVPLLWRFHRMHHADLDFDVTTGLRFHPVEIALSLGIKLAVVAVLGPPAVAVLIFEVLLNGTSLFNHANLRLPGVVDRLLRRVVVTPDMHRVHHSVVRAETDSNFGFNLTWWDRLFGTYRDQPAAGHEGMTIGIPLFRAPEELRLHRMLLQPLRGDRDARPAAAPGPLA
jgi:sterol desaturase/sphingolipid hydroxylase (fatty acid hydroxylase superfamily)